ncbi:MAG TPA: Asp-tRNA(Asn)/Glu-tRNA(Gln) amidotransferase subunit GatC [Anaerolineales bacterium]|nr:Asp-tRNA(Asn)/Glu-tRNA(Gln) amidotransferase subunit GatC [Anaerolineales bacterium]
MSLSREEIDHIAALARLRLTEAEKDLYRGQLSAVLDYIAKLSEVDTTPIPPTATVLPLRTVLRPDVVRPSLPVPELLRNAPDAADDMFRVPPVLDGGAEGG